MYFLGVIYANCIQLLSFWRILAVEVAHSGVRASAKTTL